MLWPIVAIVVSALAFGVAAYFYQWVKRLPTADDGKNGLNRIGQLIRQGAFTFLKREYRTLVVFCGVVAVVIFLVYPAPLWQGQGAGENVVMAVSYLFGSRFPHWPAISASA